MDVVCRWPGSVHDTRILRESGLFHLFENGHMPQGFHLLGDSGYPAKRSHKITRALVERGIGQLKRRFGILHREIVLQPEKAIVVVFFGTQNFEKNDVRRIRLVLAFCVLHNIGTERAIPMAGPDDEDAVNDGDGRPQPQADNFVGLRYREQFKTRYFVTDHLTGRKSLLIQGVSGHIMAALTPINFANKAHSSLVSFLFLPCGHVCLHRLQRNQVRAH
ncbi:HARB1-like protein, partial [Mya arenaria]